MKNLSTPIGGLLLAGLLAGCGSTSTEVERSWKAPEVGSLHFTKVLVIALTPDGATRRLAEDTMKAQVTSVPVVASYELAPNTKVLRDRAQMAEVIKTSGADCIVTMRPASSETEFAYVPGSAPAAPNAPFWGYYSQTSGLSELYRQDSGAFVADKLVGIETNIYAAKDGQLVWSGYTKTLNPEKVAELVSEVAATVKAKLRNLKLIP